MSDREGPLATSLGATFGAFGRAADRLEPSIELEEVGRITFVGHGIARVDGLPRVASDEVVRFPGDRLGTVFNLDAGEVGIVLLDRADDLFAGTEVRRTMAALEVPVGETLVGRVVDPIGRPLDGMGPVHAVGRLPVERPAPGIMSRAPVRIPLQTGFKVIDALIPVGRGQRELILGDRQTGKTAIAVDAILNQDGDDVLCVYCAIGQRASSVARVVEDLRSHGAHRHSIVVATSEEDPPGLQFVAPYAAMSMAEHFMARGRDVLVVLDDLTRHARAYREISLLLRRPPGREAFPGDVFYIHSRLLERSTRLSPAAGGGSVTTLPIVETETENLSAYIPTNLISITDGQVYLSPRLFHRGILPAVDVGRSVSRVGGKTQRAAYRKVAADLRLTYSQFEELEAFARFGTRLDEATRRTLERGRRVREVLLQPQYEPMTVGQQVAILLAVSQGILDEVPIEAIGAVEDEIRRRIEGPLAGIAAGIEEGGPLEAADRAALLEAAREVVAGR